jgi:hypothetical protein
MAPLTYSLQFRGQVDRLPGGLRKRGRAPGCALVTSITPDGLDARYVWSPAEDEALLESTLAFTDGDRFREAGTIVFSRGHALRLHGQGELARSADPHLRHGTVVWEVAGGAGRYEGASGRITSNFVLSDTGDLTENQLGVIFLQGSVQGFPRREGRTSSETIEPPPGNAGSQPKEE